MLECTEGLGEIQEPAAGQRIVRLAAQRPTQRRSITPATAANLEGVVHSRDTLRSGKRGYDGSSDYGQKPHFSQKEP